MKNKTLWIIIGLAILGVVVYSLFASKDQVGQSETSQDSGQEVDFTRVSMFNSTFEPEAVAIQVGETIIWENDDTETHTVTIPALNIDQTVPGGEAFEYTFEEVGTYDYECTIHPEMEGTIIVEAVTTSE